MRKGLEERELIGSYFIAQMKRMLRLLPSVAGVAAAMGCAVILLAGVFSRGVEQSEEKPKYSLGIVGDVSDSYLGFGISALSFLDDTRFMLNLVEMTEEDALRRLRSGEISGYVSVPDGLVDSLVAGANDKPIALVGPESQMGIQSILIEELADIASVLITRSQSTIYGVQYLLRERGMGERVAEETDIINLRLIGLVLTRSGLCRLEITGDWYHITVTAYYFVGLLLFFLLLSGIYSNSVFSSRSRELMRLSAARGVSPARQIGMEYVSYFCLELCCLGGLFVLIGLLLGAGVFEIPEWGEGSVVSLLAFSVWILPVAALVAAMQFLLYELAAGVVNSVLLQFLSAVVLGYLSGCFYPVKIFPGSLQTLSHALPTGLAMNYMCFYFEEIMRSRIPAEFFGILAYTVLFLGLSVLARKWKLRR